MIKKVTKRIGKVSTRAGKHFAAVASGATILSAANIPQSPVTGRMPEISDANFCEARHELRFGDVVIKLTDYQMEALRDQHRIVILKWCRQAGKDFLTSLKAVLSALETGENWYIVSLTQRQALATAKKAQQHVRTILKILPEIGVTEEVIKGFKITSYGVKLPNGAEVIALPGKDPDALAGLSGNVIFTEMALFPNNGIDHWRVVFPLISRGFRIWAISTPRGPATKFAELCRNPKGIYGVHMVDIHAAVKGGLKLTDDNGKPSTPADLEALYNDAAGWSREYLCIEGEDHEALIGWPYIQACFADYEIPWVHIEGMTDLRGQFDTVIDSFFAPIRKAATGRLVGGWDIAVTGDMSAWPIGELLGDVIWARGLVTAHKVDDFDYQRDVTRNMLKVGATVIGDASGLGRDACQTLEKEYPNQFKGLVLTSDSKTELCVQGMQAFQGAKFRFPKDFVEYHYDIYSVAKDSVGVAKRLRIIQTKNPMLPHSHGDVAIGTFLMIDAGQTGSVEVETLPPPVENIPGAMLLPPHLRRQWEQSLQDGGVIV